MALRRCYFVLTDSGGIQEEAPVLGKPVLIMRNTTERPEALKAGTAKLVGTDGQIIVGDSLRLLQDPRLYQRMAKVNSLFGDGEASQRIVKALMFELGLSAVRPADFERP